jgi:sec-independent protein translocase protein TatC
MATTVESTSMTLGEHLNELRSRIVKCAAAILLMTGLVWSKYELVFGILREPYDSAHEQHPQTILELTGVTSGLALQLNVALIGGLIFSSPIWIYQIWRFVAPGLHRKEKKWAVLFTGIAVPMFLAGCWLGYAVLPGTLNTLFEFTPPQVSNVTNVDSYISFALHLTLFFGLGFLIPVLLLILNFFGIASGKSMLHAWRWIVVGALFFCAISTPNGDPLGMTIIALPIMVLCFGAIGLAVLNDRRVAGKTA